MESGEGASPGVDFASVFGPGSADPERGRLWETFPAYSAGYCERQMYLTQVNATDQSDIQGRLDARRVVQEHLESELRAAELDAAVEVSPRVTLSSGCVRWVGRPTCYDLGSETVYHLKPRNGWYKFHPPVQRHVDQLEVYTRATGGTRGRLVYVSMADLSDHREWPPAGYQERDGERFGEIVARATRVRDELVSNGIATTPGEIPFGPCGCYLCETETLRMSESAGQATAAGGSTPTPEAEAESEPTSTSGVESGAVGQPAGAAPDGGTVSGTHSTAPSPASSPPDPLSLPDREPAVVETAGRHVPQELQAVGVWVVWDGREKVALAPWQEGTMYPCRWARDGDLDPRRSYEKARMVCELPVAQVHASWPFPDSDDLPDRVLPAVLLPHERRGRSDPSGPPLAFVDFDAVRDPATGEVSGEALALVEALGGYTEVSRSGTGLHTYVRGALPPECNMVSGPLAAAGRIEMYDHSRFTAGTWRHLDGTPRDSVPAVGETLRAIARRYEPSLDERKV